MDFKMETLRGFTLVEMMVVLALVLILILIAVPNMIRSKIIANETAAIASCRTISNACILFYGKNDRFPDTLYGGLQELIPPISDPCYINPNLANATTTDTAMNGYYYIYTSDNTNGTFTLNANPKSTLTGKRYFYVDQTGVIRYNLTRAARPSDPPI